MDECITESAMQLVPYLSLYHRPEGDGVIGVRGVKREHVQDRLRRKKRLACIRLYQTPGYPTIPSLSQSEIPNLSEVESYS